METAFSSQLQKLRRDSGITQEALASHLGVSPQAVSKWENGSYPDGDLLPRLADFFGVSIDYLYGRAKKEVSAEQHIIDALQTLPLGEANNHPKNFEQMLNYMWAVQIAAWRNNKHYYDRPVIDDPGIVTASEITDSAGFTFMRLNRDLEYFFLVKQPKDGFAKRLKATDKVTELFRFLGDKSNLKILQYMLSLNDTEAVRAETIAKLLNIPTEKAEKALNYLCNFDGTFSRGSIVDENNRSENIYRSYWIKTTAPILLLICAELMTNPPCGYQNQIGWRERAWFDREDLDFLKKSKE